MTKEDRDTETHSQDLGASRIESIEELLRKRGFFDSVERVQKKDEPALVH
jgi:hypothetical protein